MKCTGIIYVLLLILHFSKTDEDVTKHPGHLKPFGFTGEWNKLEETNVFPSTENFFTNYVLKNKPLKMKGVVKESKPCTSWSDDYFLELDVPKDSIVSVENGKKENRTHGAQDLHFHDFVRKYAAEDIYMVLDVPDYLGKDVALPDPLQCSEIIDNKVLETFVMWFSSGGTKSVVHTDSSENIICVYHGDKEFVIVDPHKYRHKVDLDQPVGSYSDINVDQVDFTKYPDLVDVEYYRVNLTAGDCMYIPYKWIHQVRSYNRNIAVNTWWSHEMGKELDLTKCPEGTAKTGDPITMDQIKLEPIQQDNNYEFSENDLKNHLMDLTLVRCISTERIPRQLAVLFTNIEDEIQELLDIDREENHFIPEVISILDIDSDGQICRSEVEQLPTEGLLDAHELLLDFEASLFVTEHGKERMEEMEREQSEKRDEL